MTSSRAGRFVKQLEGYSAFEPAALPPVPPLGMSLELQHLLSAADQAVGRLDGLTRYMPDVKLFLAMFVRNEALLSSRIEGTDCTLDDVVRFEIGDDDVPDLDVTEVVNYVAAVRRGIELLKERPLCSRLLREVHAVLLREGRGADKSPGEFRRSQNWIGPPGSGLNGASYVPPPPHIMRAAMGDLEQFWQGASLPPLVAAGLVHAQFETVHPFLDGNGQVGRLLVTLMLCDAGVLSEPVLYLSSFLRRSRARYFELLTRLRLDGDWESWLAFFLTGVAETAAHAAATADFVHRLRESDRAVVQATGDINALAVLDHLYTQPIVSARWVERSLEVAPATANKVLCNLEHVGVVTEVTGRKRNRIFRYNAYLDIFDDDDATMGDDTTLS